MRVGQEFTLDGVHYVLLARVGKKRIRAWGIESQRSIAISIERIPHDLSALLGLQEDAISPQRKRRAEPLETEEIGEMRHSSLEAEQLAAKAREERAPLRPARPMCTGRRGSAIHGDYVNPAIRELRDLQVRFAPREKKIEQADQAEKLLAELEPDRIYAYEYLCYRITKYRPQVYPDLKLTGREASHDLRLLVEDLSDAADVAAHDAGEPVLTVDELRRRFNVSAKTISRWRRQGLVSRRFLFDGRKRVGFLASSVERFVEKNQERVRRGSRFSQLTDQERRSIIERARRLAQAGRCPGEIAKRLSRNSGRSVETIRYTLNQFDRDHPDLAIFAERAGPLTGETKKKIFQQYRRGESVESLVRRFCRTRSSIYRVIAEMRAKRILELPLDYIPSPQFPRVRTETQEAEVLGAPPPAERLPKKPRLPSGLPPYLASLYEVPLLTREQEVHLFRKMNYQKYKASKLRETLDLARPNSSLMDEIERLYDQSVGVKNEIISANLRLVVSIAKALAGATEDISKAVSDGNVSLTRAVEKFEFDRGKKFSAYASRAIMKNFARTIPDEHRRREPFRTFYAEVFGGTEDSRRDQYEEESAQLQRDARVEKILQRLDEREQKIIISRFGLSRGQEPQTLRELAAELGVTKERIRQIEARALSKLRRAAHEQKIEARGYGESAGAGESRDIVS